MGSGFDVHLPEEFRPLRDEFGVSTGWKIGCSYLSLWSC